MSDRVEGPSWWATQLMTQALQEGFIANGQEL